MPYLKIFFEVNYRSRRTCRLSVIELLMERMKGIRTRERDCMSKRTKFIVIDTETVDTVKRKDGKPNPSNALVYDAGWVVADADGTIYERRSFVNLDVLARRELMETAYYADKLPLYWSGLNVTWQPTDTKTIWRTLANDCKEYDVKELYAYNSRFDEQALNSTIRHMSNGWRNFFAPYKTVWRDVWAMAGETICASKKYVRWCDVNGFITQSGNPSTSAETVYRYICGNLNFEEQHTALSDAEIELAILLKARKYWRKLSGKTGDGWRDAARIYREMQAG